MTKRAWNKRRDGASRERVRHGLENEVSGTLGSQGGGERSRDVGLLGLFSW